MGCWISPAIWKQIDILDQKVISRTQRNARLPDDLLELTGADVKRCEEAQILCYPKSFHTDGTVYHVQC